MPVVFEPKTWEEGWAEIRRRLNEKFSVEGWENRRLFQPNEFTHLHCIVMDTMALQRHTEGVSLQKEYSALVTEIVQRLLVPKLKLPKEEFTVDTAQTFCHELNAVRQEFDVLHSWIVKLFKSGHAREIVKLCKKTGHDVFYHTLVEANHAEIAVFVMELVQIVANEKEAWKRKEEGSDAKEDANENANDSVDVVETASKEDAETDDDAKPKPSQPASKAETALEELLVLLEEIGHPSARLPSDVNWRSFVEFLNNKPDQNKVEEDEKNQEDTKQPPAESTERTSSPRTTSFPTPMGTVVTNAMNGEEAQEAFMAMMNAVMQMEGEQNGGNNNNNNIHNIQAHLGADDNGDQDDDIEDDEDNIDDEHVRIDNMINNHIRRTVAGNNHNNNGGANMFPFMGQGGNMAGGVAIQVEAGSFSVTNSTSDGNNTGGGSMVGPTTSKPKEPFVLGYIPLKTVFVRRFHQDILPHISNLMIGNCPTTDRAGFSLFCQGLKEPASQHLQSLSLIDCEDMNTDDRWKELTEALRVKPGVKLRQVNVGQNDITPESLPFVVHLMESLPHLESMGLAFHSTAFCEADAASVQVLCEALVRGAHPVTTLDMLGCDAISEDVATALCRAVMHSSGTLRNFRLGTMALMKKKQNVAMNLWDFRTSANQHMAPAFVVSVARNLLTRNDIDNLSALFMKNMNLEESLVVQLSAALTENLCRTKGALRALSLRQCYLDDALTNRIVAAIEAAAAHLEEADTAALQLRDIDFCANRLDNACDTAVKLLNCCQNLESLALMGNRHKMNGTNSATLTSKHIKPLLQAITRRPTLQKLGLFHSIMTENGRKALFGVLEKMPHLAELDVTGLDVRDRMRLRDETLLTHLVSHKLTLVQLHWVRYDYFSDPDYNSLGDKIEDLLKRNRLFVASGKASKSVPADQSSVVLERLGSFKGDGNAAFHYLREAYTPQTK